MDAEALIESWQRLQQATLNQTALRAAALWDEYEKTPTHVTWTIAIANVYATSTIYQTQHLAPYCLEGYVEGRTHWLRKATSWPVAAFLSADFGDRLMSMQKGDSVVLSGRAVYLRMSMLMSRDIEFAFRIFPASL